MSRIDRPPPSFPRLSRGEAEAIWDTDILLAARGPRRQALRRTAGSALIECLLASTAQGEDAVVMLRPVEVHHEGRWVAATLLATRRGADGWEGLVGYTDPDTRQGFYHWCPEVMLREPLEAAASDPVERRGVRRQL